MTVPLWGLVVLILWAIVVVVLLLIVRIRHLAAGGSPKDFGTSDHTSPLWRFLRVQANLMENVPLYLGVVFLLVVRGASGTLVDLFAGTYIVFRLFHSIVHMLGANPNLRLFSLVIQFICLISLLSLATFNH
ncbi:MAPEG family protein [Leptolyngbya sp. FACHB-16]|nr:MAPEG family protein [Leptolyngbya sp. FACHB-8]MBD1909810.1 MAPEG family protein [Leptolyngbya sp. FACHB-8]MBD2158961.1 MAPEG family protein [Leptolyngbya sp. FACHB-16]